MDISGRLSHSLDRPPRTTLEIPRQHDIGTVAKCHPSRARGTIGPAEHIGVIVLSPGISQLLNSRHSVYHHGTSHEFQRLAQAHIVELECKVPLGRGNAHFRARSGLDIQDYARSPVVCLDGEIREVLVGPPVVIHALVCRKSPASRRIDRILGPRVPVSSLQEFTTRDSD